MYMLDSYKKSLIEHDHIIEDLQYECSITRFSSNWSERLSLAFNNRGLIKYKLVRFDEAIDDYNLSILHNPNFAIPYYNRGTINYRMGNYVRASTDFQKAIHISPQFHEARLALARTISQLKVLEEI